MRLLLDSNVFDWLVESDERFQRVAQLAREGRVEILTTHIQEDQLQAMAAKGDPEKHAKLDRIMRIPRELVSTAGFVLDVSRLGLAGLGPPEPIEAVRTSRKNSDGVPRHTEDALIAATALWEDVVLVTNEKRLRNRARDALGVDVWDLGKLEEHLKTS